MEKLGRCEEALESYRKALKLKPEYNEAKKALKKLEKSNRTAQQSYKKQRITDTQTKN